MVVESARFQEAWYAGNLSVCSTKGFQYFIDDCFRMPLVWRQQACGPGVGVVFDVGFNNVLVDFGMFLLNSIDFGSISSWRVFPRVHTFIGAARF